MPDTVRVLVKRVREYLAQKTPLDFHLMRALAVRLDELSLATLPPETQADLLVARSKAGVWHRKTQFRGDEDYATLESLCQLIERILNNCPAEDGVMGETHRAETLPSHAQAAELPSPIQEILTPVDYGVITVRGDEFKAIHDRLGPTTVVSRKDRFYHVGQLKSSAAVRSLAIARCNNQGNLEAADLARDLIDEFQPKLVMLCGIAGGVPRSDTFLGDVILADHICDFSVSAENPDGQKEYSVLGGPLKKSIKSLAVNLAALMPDDWRDPSKLRVERPDEVGQILKECTPDWRAKVVKACKAAAQRPNPTFDSGPIGSSDVLVKNPDLLEQLLKYVRSLRAVEMEAAGALRVLDDQNVPFMVVRGISDVVGLERLEEWTPYACATAASFLIAMLTCDAVDSFLNSVNCTDRQPAASKRKGAGKTVIQQRAGDQSVQIGQAVGDIHIHR